MSVPESSELKAPSVKLMRFAAAGAGLLVIAGSVAFYYASQIKHADPASNAFRVNVGAHACDPNAITIPAGRSTFEITNASERVVEWEILSGVMVVAERENIAPGLRQTLTATLAPGSYEITCGLLSNPRGTLQVTSSQAYADEAAHPTLKAFIGPLSEYKVYLAMQGAALVEATAQLAEAIKAGNLKQARALYKAARAPYNRIEAVTDRIADLKNAIDPVADYLEKREQDPAFTGFHRLEYGLFTVGSTQGLEPFADKLVADVTALKQRLPQTKLAPEDLAGSAGNLAARMAQQSAKPNLAEMEDNLAGLDKMIALLRPVLAPAAADVAADVDAKLAAAKASLEKLKGADGLPAPDKVDVAAQQTLAKAFEYLAGALSQINVALGLG